MGNFLFRVLRKIINLKAAFTIQEKCNNSISFLKLLQFIMQMLENHIDYGFIEAT